MKSRMFFFPIIVAATLAWGSSAGLTQSYPGDPGNGYRLGMQEANNSGEVGSVTLFRHGDNATLVVVHVDSEPGDRVQPAHIHRGHSCDAVDPKPMYGLAPVVNGYSRTLVLAPEDKLLSGNYAVVVHASAQNIGHYVSCGTLYRS